MKKWEDIVKQKMEEFDGTLPDSVLAQFHARQNSQARKPIVWIWAAVPAVAAAVAAILLLHRPSVPETDGGVQLIEQAPVPVVEVVEEADTVEFSESVLVAPKPRLVAQAKPEPAAPEEPLAQKAAEPAETKPEEPVTKEEPQAEEEYRPVEEPAATSPFIPEPKAAAKPVRMKVAPAAGIVAGTGLLAAVITPLVGSGRNLSYDTGIGNSPVLDPGSDTNDPGEHYYVPDVNLLTDTHTQYPFIRGGVSLGIPVSKRWKLTTGVEYSLYKTFFTYSMTGVKQQSAHYLGIPVRMDWSIASNKWLDVYLGAGMEGDFCVAASLGGEKIQRDGFSFSLLGAAGVQFNCSRRIGLYLEPELSWTVPSGSRVLMTYRSQHPFFFTVAAGVRFNL
jgi:opacity protein-like surface antigen